MEILISIKANNDEEIIVFEHDGVTYTMTASQMEAAYRCQEQRYRLRDALRHLNIFVYGVDKNYGEPISEEDETEDDRKNRLLFEKIYGVAYQTLSAPAMLETFVKRFKDNFDCRVSEKSQWDNVIRHVLPKTSNN